ncbi:hypothetical protein ABIE67_009127 [Streptomyces sp. V4I8]|uniref:terpene synthase family protein n=1 Tax=Streptomyces sp. V4I8 TaxID=3156469 RepID=UPI0035131F08
MTTTINPGAIVPFAEVAQLERLSRSPLPLPPQILDIAQNIRRDLVSWAQDYPAVVHGRAGDILRWMPLCAAVSYDGAPYRTALEFARHCVVVFAYDDVLDEEIGEPNTLEGLQTLTQEWLRVLSGPAGKEEAVLPASGTGRLQQLLLALVDSMRRVMDSPEAQQHQERWQELWQQASTGMLQELAWRHRTVRQPDFVTYMRTARSSIAVEATHWAAFITSAPADVLPEETDLLISVLKRAGYIIRLANDLNTVERDHQSNAANALLLTVDRWSCSVSEARALLRKHLEQELKRLFAVRASIAPAITDHYGWIVRSTVFACQWYLNRYELELTPEDLRAIDRTD